MKTRFPLANLLHEYESVEWAKDWLPSVSKAIKDALGDRMDGAEVVRKGKTQPPVEVIEDGERAVIKWVSTRDKDRDLEIVDPKGVDLADFKLAPVVLLNHDYRSLPIGIDEWVTADDYGVKAKVRYANTQVAEDVFQLNKDGILNTSSIGFIPIEYVLQGGAGWAETIRRLGKRWNVPDTYFDGVSCIYNKVLLLEHSDVSVPSNIHARNIVTAKGFTPYGEDYQALREDGIDGILGPEMKEITVTIPEVTPVGVKVVGKVPLIQRLTEGDVRKIARDAIRIRQGRP